MSSRLVRRIVVASVFLWSGPRALAQCPQWSPAFGGGNGIGASGHALSAAVFDDGTGPALYVGGLFHSVGGVPAERIARWDGTTWSALGAGIDLRVQALCVFDDGNGAALYAAGDFTMAGGSPASRIAKWDGSSWSPLGLGLNAVVYCLAVYDDGTGPALYAGGAFTTAGGVPANHVARWDGSTWSAVGGGTSGAPHTMTPMHDGHGPSLFVGGPFLYAEGQFAFGAARWDQNHFEYMDTGMSDTGHPEASVVFDDGTGPALYVGGGFSMASGAPTANIARWTPAGAWVPVGNGLDGGVSDLCVFDDGQGSALYAVGQFGSMGGSGTMALAKWTGSTWTNVGRFDDRVFALVPYSDGQRPASLFALGEFTSVAGIPSRGIAELATCGGAGTAYCFGDGSGSACPCGNPSAGGSRLGCTNSLGAGASLRASGTASLSGDSIVLVGAGMPESSALFFQGTSRPNSGLGVQFGDGLRCAGGTVVRLGTKSNSGGSSRYPESGDAPVSVRGNVTSIGSRAYQCWYRNSAAFCTAATFNTTNGWEIVWQL